MEYIIWGLMVGGGLYVFANAFSQMQDQEQSSGHVHADPARTAAGGPVVVVVPVPYPIGGRMIDYDRLNANAGCHETDCHETESGQPMTNQQKPVLSIGYPVTPPNEDQKGGHEEKMGLSEKLTNRLKAREFQEAGHSLNSIAKAIYGYANGRTVQQVQNLLKPYVGEIKVS